MIGLDFLIAMAVRWAMAQGIDGLEGKLDEFKSWVRAEIDNTFLEMLALGAIDLLWSTIVSVVEDKLRDLQVPKLPSIPWEQALKIEAECVGKICKSLA